MPNRSADSVFQLIKSLEKSEKRNFKLYIGRNSGQADLKIVQLFDALDKMEEYEEAALLKKVPEIKKQQLSNTKALLYRHILTSLRLLRDEETDIQLHEQMDFARLLYNKGLYHQSLRLLEKIKEQANARFQYSVVFQALQFEKKIEGLHITRSMEDRAEQLSKEGTLILNRLQMVSKLSDLALQLYSWYIQMGHARDEKDLHALKLFYETRLPVVRPEDLCFYGKLYLWQCYCWYAFIQQDLLNYYRYTQKWVDLFYQHPFMIGVETGQYIKGMHNLLSAHFMLGNGEKFAEALHLFEQFAASEEGMGNDNTRIQSFVYLQTARINRHFMEGTFSEGLELVPDILEKLKEYELQLDRHRVLVFYYKIACLYFGSGRNEEAITFLNKIIHWKVDLRTDLQCYSRLLHLIAHYELGNHDLLEYLIKSVYRFMANMQNLSVVEEEIFKFLRKSFSINPLKLKSAFKALKEKLERNAGNPLESRSFMYLDILGWLESKIEGIPVQEVIKRRYQQGRKIKQGRLSK